MIKKLIDYLKNKNVLILGFGLEGQSTYKLIRKYLPDLNLTIADKVNDFDKQYNYLSIDKNIIIKSGLGYLNNISDSDLIIKTPGISLKDLDVTNYAYKITSQLDLFLEFIHVKTIGITGTKGKSTTSSLIHKVLEEQDINSLLLGNIGTPIFDYIEEIKNNTTVVLELSSHQLEFVRKSPNISIFLNIYEEHLDHYKSIDEYIAAKYNIAKYQCKNDCFIYNVDNKLMANYLKEHKLNIKSKKYPITCENRFKSDNYLFLNNNKIYIKNNNNEKLVYDANDKRKLIGSHNLNNIMFVLAISEILNLDLNKTINTINSFEGLTHRMEYVGYYNNIYFYNDSIATIPEATMHCIDALKTVDTLIIGGMDRGINFNNFIEYLNNGKVRNLICMPDTGHLIANKITNNEINLYKIESLQEAVELSKTITEKDKICLLSPASASYGFFKNFKEKGNEFKRLVKEEK